MQYIETIQTDEFCRRAVRHFMNDEQKNAWEAHVRAELFWLVLDGTILVYEYKLTVVSGPIEGFTCQ